MGSVVVVGAGPAGLAAAAELKRRGVEAVVVDRAERVGDSWRRHYESLRLHTVNWLSALPGLRFPPEEGAWVSRDGVVRYLERYAAHHGLDVRLATEVRRIDRVGGGWRLATTAGELQARAVVIATGYNNAPRVPAWPGADRFTGELVHSSSYRNAAPYRGRDVLVVGTGNSATEIALDLVRGGAGKVWLAVRTPPHIVRREPPPNPLLGVLLRPLPVAAVDAAARVVRRVTVGDLRPYGLAPPPRGLYTRIRDEGSIPIIDTGIVAEIKARRVEVVPAVVGFDGDDVLLAGGRRLRAGIVIAATGFARVLEPLVGHLGLLDERGLPVVHGARSDRRAPGLYFIGFSNPISGNLREVAIDARRIARAVADATVVKR